MSRLFGNPVEKFSRDEAHVLIPSTGVAYITRHNVQTRATFERRCFHDGYSQDNRIFQQLKHVTND